MKFTALEIATRREMPARARTPGEGLLIRAGYLGSAGQLSALGELAVSRLRAWLRDDPQRIQTICQEIIRTSEGEILFPDALGGQPVLRCAQCGYAATADKARARKRPLPAEPLLPLQRVATPECRTIESLASYLGVPQAKTGKALLHVRPESPALVMVVIRGDMQLSESKLRAAAGPLLPATHEQITKAGAVPGYASPIGLQDVRILVDDLIPDSFNLVVGANEEGFHLRNANFGRDFSAGVVADLALAHPDDPCILCGGPLKKATGSLLADSEGLRYPEILRTLAQQQYDDRGLHLPVGMAPVDVHLLHLPARTGGTRAAAEQVHQALEAADIPVLFDDRDERAGVKFKDADLIGIPLRLTVAERHMQARLVELKFRSGAEIELIPHDEVVERMRSLTKIPQ
jgi:prolyl-tRNA synthetase